MNMRKIALSASIAASLLMPAMPVQADDDAIIDATFWPYKKGIPTIAGLKPGTVIDKSNVDQFRNFLAVGMYRHLKEGNFVMRIGATKDYPLSPQYIDATRKGIGKVSIGTDGNLKGYVAGRPFPEEPRADDPKAGEKLAWNYKYGVNWGDNASINPFFWRYRNMNTGKIEKTLKFEFHFLNLMHRVKDAPVPEVPGNASKIYRAIYVKALEPQDLKNTQLLIQRYEDDLKLDDAYLYLGFQRRVRRLATGQVTDAFLGSDLMIEDFEGYNARSSDMNWTYKGTKYVLLPMWDHNALPLAADMPAEPDGYKYVNFGGKGGCFFDGTWQLRKVYVLEAAPKSKSHPISKRVFYMDSQLQNINGAIEIYDRKGQLWKTFSVGKSHPNSHLPLNRNSGIGIDDAYSMVDLQSGHCTTGQFKGQVSYKQNPPGMFQVQNLRGGD